MSKPLTPTGAEPWAAPRAVSCRVRRTASNSWVGPWHLAKLLRFATPSGICCWIQMGHVTTWQFKASNVIIQNPVVLNPIQPTRWKSRLVAHPPPPTLISSNALIPRPQHYLEVCSQNSLTPSNYFDPICRYCVIPCDTFPS